MVVFSAVLDDSKKQMLLQKILSSNGQMYFKDKSERSIAIKPISLNSNLQIKCLLPPASSVSEEKMMNISFSLDEEKYMFEASPVVAKSHITLTVLNFFHLQRRRNYRYVLPKNYSAELVINSLNKEDCSCRCKLLDLSNEGCAAQIRQENVDFNVDDKFSAEILLGERTPVAVQGVIKNIRVQNENLLVLGISFNYLGNSSEEKIIHYLTDLQREVYLKKAS
ncbi:MAG: PilZ domain-containing protein [Bdellovibrio sp.]